MNAILAALLLLPALGRAADSRDSMLKRLKEIETARVRRRGRWLLAGLAGAVALIGWLVYTIRRRRASA